MLFDITLSSSQIIPISLISDRVLYLGNVHKQRTHYDSPINFAKNDAHHRCNFSFHDNKGTEITVCVYD